MSPYLEKALQDTYERINCKRSIKLESVPPSFAITTYILQRWELGCLSCSTIHLTHKMTSLQKQRCVMEIPHETIRVPFQTVSALTLHLVNLQVHPLILVNVSRMQL